MTKVWSGRGVEILTQFVAPPKFSGSQFSPLSSSRMKRLDRKEAPFKNVGKYSPLGRWSKHTSIPTKMTNLAW